jgi:uncharacterized glyoxalase superfamily protein PhnB
MQTQISPMLAVSHGREAVEFYQKAFGATLLWCLGGGADMIAGLSINGADFFLAKEAPKFGTRSPQAAGFTTARIELFVDDPVDAHRRAIAAGASNHSAVEEHRHETLGERPITRMLQGAVVDPFGHLWLIGKVLS